MFFTKTRLPKYVPENGEKFYFIDIQIIVIQAVRTLNLDLEAGVSETLIPICRVIADGFRRKKAEIQNDGVDEGDPWRQSGEGDCECLNRQFTASSRCTVVLTVAVLMTWPERPDD